MHTIAFIVIYSMSLFAGRLSRKYVKLTDKSNQIDCIHIALNHNHTAL